MTCAAHGARAPVWLRVSVSGIGRGQCVESTLMSAGRASAPGTSWREEQGPACRREGRPLPGVFSGHFLSGEQPFPKLPGVFMCISRVSG